MSLFRLMLVFAVVTGFGHAADVDPSSKGISIRLFAVELHDPQGPVCLMAGERRNSSFQISTTSLSEAQSVSDRSFNLISATAPEDSPVTSLAKVVLPEQGRDFRIILVPAKDGTYKTVVVRADDPKFSHGDFFFINLSTHEMLGQLGSVRLDLKPGGTEFVSPGGAKSDKFFEVRFARRDGSQLVPLTNTCWPVVRDNRSFVIFYNGRKGRPTYRAVDEFMPLAIAAPPD